MVVVELVNSRDFLIDFRDGHDLLLSSFKYAISPPSADLVPVACLAGRVSA